jgi:glycosyltransferase involved in cell wall biosynthesis
VIVAQIGARHDYAVPRMLEGAGRLQAFYTDANGLTGLGAWLRRLPVVRNRGRIAKLVGRIPRGVPAAKIRHTDALLRRRLRAVVGLGPEPRGYVDDDHLFDRIVAGWGFAGADTLYAMQKHGTLILEAARRAGLRTVVDVFITPVAHRVVAAERDRFSDWEEPAAGGVAADLEDERTGREIEHADLLLCPGWNVVEGLASFPNAAGKAFAVVPYGCGAPFGGRRNEPVAGRILFAGTADLRKGIHYLAMAAELLRGKGYQFRVAGSVTDAVRRHPRAAGLNFLGRLPRERMLEEFLQADVFVLPTLAEGCASVVHEAVTAGCPVITTPAAGTLIGDMRGGLLVPERDAEALAAALERVLGDRECRSFLAASCEELALELTEESWCRRLLAALDNRAPERIGGNPKLL